MTAQEIASGYAGRLAAATLHRQPIVIFGGFFSTPRLYHRMRDALAGITRQPAYIVDAWTREWALALRPAGWVGLLQRLDRAVRQAVRNSTTGKITLIGHSTGGVVGRLYLSPEPFRDRAYRGLECVDHLITLGSPHHSRHGGWMGHWVDDRYPGAYFAPHVQYRCVAGKMIRGDRHGSLAERWAYGVYRGLNGDGEVWGDGLIPLPSALLEGAQQILLEGVAHYRNAGGVWYGSAEVIPKWWDQDIHEDGPAREGALR